MVTVTVKDNNVDQALRVLKKKMQREGIFREMYGTSGQAYSVPEALSGATNLGFMVLPNYRAWVVLASLAVCMGTWYLIERTRLGAYLRAGTENAALVQAAVRERLDSDRPEEG